MDNVNFIEGQIVEDNSFQLVDDVLTILVDGVQHDLYANIGSPINLVDKVALATVNITDKKVNSIGTWSDARFTWNDPYITWNGYS